MRPATSLSLSLCTLLILTGSNGSASQQTPQQITGAIDATLSGLSHVRFFTTRPGLTYPSRVDGWFAGSKLRKLQVLERDDSGDLVTDHYFDNSTLRVSRQTSMRFISDSQQTPGSDQTLSHQDSSQAGSVDEGESRAHAAGYELRKRADYFAARAHRMHGRITAGRLDALSAGDRACYLSITTRAGSTEEIPAMYGLCESAPPLINTRVNLQYRFIHLMSASCEGDPECRETTETAVVEQITPHDQPASGPVCHGARRVFDCISGDKRITACSDQHGEVSLEYGVTTEEQAPEIRYLSARENPGYGVSGEPLAFAAGGGTWLRLRDTPFAFVLYSGIGRWGSGDEPVQKAGLLIERGGEAHVRIECSGPQTGELGPDWLSQLQITGDDQGFDFP